MSRIYPSDLVDAKGNVYPTVGENIRRGFNVSSTPQPEPPEPKEFGTVNIIPLTVDFSDSTFPKVYYEDGTRPSQNEFIFDFQKYYLYCLVDDFIGILGIDWGNGATRGGNYPVRYGLYGGEPVIDLSKVHTYNWVTGTFKIYVMVLKR